MKHIHRLKKHKYKNNTSVFFCTLVDCHYKIEAPLALGKESLCNICNESFIMNEYSLKLSRPHCINCGKVEVKDENGKRHYINKRKASTKVLVTIAEDTTNDLKARLEGVVKDLHDDEI